MAEKTKTAAYTRKAIDRYKAKYDTLSIRIEKEYNIKSDLEKYYGKDRNDIIKNMILEDLERRKKEN